ncbi:MAG: nucleotidyltransferase domain-containing protein [Chloroflexi bacterium]|nr:nucleotidyltransferase domain-containing protein [Chloroflexota bacterium]
MRLVAGDTGLMAFAYLALHEGEQRTLQELASAVARAPQVVQAALRSLVNEGLVIASAKPPGTGRGALYSANRASPIFSELQQIAVKLLGGRDMLREAITANDAVDAAAIFGSVAAGSDRRANSLSDIDLLVIFADASTRDDRFAVRSAVSHIAERLNREISVQAHTRSEWEQGRRANRVLRRISEGDLLVLKGVIGAMPKLQPEDPKTLRSLLEMYGTLDLGIDPDEIVELLDQADEEIREADWDLKGQSDLGERPIAVYREPMARLAEARAEQSEGGRGR